MTKIIQKNNLLIATLLFSSFFFTSCKGQTKSDKTQPTISKEEAISISKDLIHIEPINCLVTTIDNMECIICIANKSGEDGLYTEMGDIFFYKLTKFADTWRVDTQKPVFVNSAEETYVCNFYNDFEIATIGNKPYLYFLYLLSSGGNATDYVDLNFALFSLTDFQLTTLNYGGDYASNNNPADTLYPFHITGDFTNLEKLTSKPDLSKFLEDKASKSPFVNRETNQEIDINIEDNSKEDQPFSSDDQETNILGFLKNSNGKYPSEVNLLENPTLKKRLRKMIGNRYDFVVSIWEVEVPIEIKDGIFFSHAMQAHSGGNPGATITVDLTKDVLYVGIKENDELKIYSEDGSKSPQCLVDWSN